MHISAKVDYAIRALLTLANQGEIALSGAALAQDQGIPAKFLEGILAELRRSGFVEGTRGPHGGYRLARDASEISLADVMRAMDGPLAAVRGRRPETVSYQGATVYLRDVWIAVRASLRSVLETTSLAQVASGKLPALVHRLAEDPDAWQPH